MTPPEATAEVRSPPPQHERRMAARPGPRICRSSAAEDHDVTTAPLHALPAAKRRRLIIIGLLRASAVTAALVVAYYLLPLDHLAGVPLGVSLAAGLLALAAMAAYQVRAIIRARYPGIRAIEALATTAPLFLLLFAATYVQMASFRVTLSGDHAARAGVVGVVLAE